MSDSAISSPQEEICSQDARSLGNLPDRNLKSGTIPPYRVHAYEVKMVVSRRSMIQASLASSTFLFGEIVVPAMLLAEVPSADPNQWFWFPGHSFCMKSTGKDTGGTSAWLMAENAPKQGVPFHKHKNEDESFLVVEGTFELSVGDKTVVGGPGTYAFGPRGVPHRWTNVGEGRGRIMNVYTPSGFEAMFYEIGLPIPNSAAPPPQDPAPIIARMPALTEKYGNTRTGDFKYPPTPRKG